MYVPGYFYKTEHGHDVFPDTPDSKLPPRHERGATSGWTSNYSDGQESSAKLPAVSDALPPTTRSTSGPSATNTRTLPDTSSTPGLALTALPGPSAHATSSTPGPGLIALPGPSAPDTSSTPGLALPALLGPSAPHASSIPGPAQTALPPTPADAVAAAREGDGFAELPVIPPEKCTSETLGPPADSLVSEFARLLPAALPALEAIVEQTRSMKNDIPASEHTAPSPDLEPPAQDLAAPPREAARS